MFIIVIRVVLDNWLVHLSRLYKFLFVDDSGVGGKSIIGYVIRETGPRSNITSQSCLCDVHRTPLITDMGVFADFASNHRRS